MSANAVQKLYVAYFNRPADTLGLNYWVSVVAANGGSTALVSAAFASSAEYAATYAGMSTAARVDAIYNNLFGRSAEPAGLTYWGQLIESGRISISNAVTQIANGAQGTDLAAYNNKVKGAEAFTTALDTTAEIVAYSGTAANNAAKAWMTGITTDATLTTATTTAALNATVASVTAPVAPVVPPVVTPTFAVSGAAASVDEGSAVIFTLQTTNVAAGATYSYILSGVSAADVAGGSLTGTVTIGSDGKALIPVTLVADAATEGVETLTVTVAGKTASATVNDTSTTPAPVPLVAVLTTGVDTGAAFTGTSRDDTFNADNTGAAVVLSASDSLDGGSGTDTLNVYSTGAAFNLPALTSIETLNVYDQTASQSIAPANFASVTTANLIRGDGALTLTGGANLATIGLTDIVAAGAAGDVGVVLAFEAARTSATVNLNTVTAAGADADENVDINGAALTTVTVNTTGTASSFDVLDVASATTIVINAAVGLTVTSLETGATSSALTITGAGAVNLATLDTAINTVTASTATGALTAVIGAEVDTVVTLGSGNDVITAGTTDALVAANALAVNAGAGTGDVLIVAATADIDTAADGARYTNFEIIRTDDSMDMSLVAGVTALQITGGTSEVYSGMNATQAANVTFRADNTTSTVFTLANATGSADAININLASTTATTNVDVIGISVIGIETVTFNATTGTNTTGDTAIGFLANSADSVSAINITGTADVTLTVAANVLDVVAVNINASTMTGTADFTLVQTSDLVAGSTVTGTLNADTIALGTTRGSTYNGGLGNDGFSGALAVLVATGTNDTIINGGGGTDTLTLSNTTTLLTDNHFTFITGMETLALSNTVGDLSLTTGSGFNAAFATGATITTGVMAATTDVTLNAGLSNVAINLTIDATDLVGTAAEVHVITTGSAADTVTFTGDATYEGVNAAAQGTIAISTGAGNDTISVTVGTLLASTGGQFATITAGTGADTITKVGTNSSTVTSVAHFVMAAGDSTTTAWDSITGFDLATGAVLSDGLDFAGTAAIGTLATSLDFGIILTHSITAGIATFDDAATYNAAVVINATNLANVVGYLALNTATNDVVAFTYDSDASGTADATMVYHNGTTDSLVLLVGTTAADALVTTNAVGANDLFIL